MKKQINLLCSILAIFCVVSMYMPVVQPRYPAGDYYAPEGSYEGEYIFSGDYYYAREYWDMTRFAFAQSSIALRLLVSIDQALLLLWAWTSVRGEAKWNGLAVALFNLLAVGIVMAMMLHVRASCRWGVVAIMALDTVATVVMAWSAARTGGKGAPEKSDGDNAPAET